MGVPSLGKRLVDDEPAGGLTLEARYADLVVLARPTPAKCCRQWYERFPEYVVMYSGRPVLIVPYAGTSRRSGARCWWHGTAARKHRPRARRRAAFAAAGGRSQGRGVQCRRAVDVHGEQPGADIALYLARHGVKVDVMQEATDRTAATPCCRRPPTPSPTCW